MRSKSSAIRHLSGLAILAAAALAAGPAAPQVFLHQGNDWTPEHRERFYVQDQGSRLMPLAWMQALRQPNGDAFLADGLARYGYLANPNGAPNVPVGFTVADDAGGLSIGMTCAACHTRQIDVSGTSYRIDGGPAIVDFQALISDLNDAVAAVRATPEAFDAFAEAVLGPDHDPARRDALRVEVETWHVRFDTLITRSLPDPGWGPSRADAISMIFNRLAGLDMGKPPTFLIEENIVLADAPTRYPFLWNAGLQDKTQWPGFADNGNSILGLSRNLGEVYGVFADFHPQPLESDSHLINRDFLKTNSANFPGLEKLEDLIMELGPPEWPWPIDHALAKEGGAIYGRATADGGCVACHGQRDGAFRSIFHKTWATPIMDVGTDARECTVLKRMVDTGVMAGAKVPFRDEIKPTDSAFNLLAASVLGAILQEKTSLVMATNEVAMTKLAATPASSEIQSLSGAFNAPGEFVPMDLVALPNAAQPKSGCAYESRVLYGIWATAPYLHNGSVQSLAEILKPAAERKAAFMLGPEYDLVAIGLADAQTRFDYTLQTTDCSDIDSGNSRCGHEYGTALSDDEKAALLEYLKTL